MTDITPSAQQNEAIRAVMEWFRDPGKHPFFYLGGYAGSGKSSIATIIAEQISGRVLYAAFTGKAALVMRSKGCDDASTIHSLIYKPVDTDDGNVEFKINHESDVARAALVIVDEVSMVGEDLALDLLSFETPILVLGDPAQLPPVGGAGFFTADEPDFMLTEIHRQALENPIIAMSMAVREGLKLDYGSYGTNHVVSSRDKSFELNLLEYDQIMCGMNRTRTSLNHMVREMLDIHAELPIVGEKLVCLKNDRKLGLLNGGIWTVERIIKPYANAISMTVRSLDHDINVFPKVYVHKNFFQGKETEMDWRERRKYNEFDFGYALTCHKSQGSQWDNILVFDESSVFGEDRNRWLYTAITRASESVTIIRD